MGAQTAMVGIECWHLKERKYSPSLVQKDVKAVHTKSLNFQDEKFHLTNSNLDYFQVHLKLGGEVETMEKFSHP